MSATAITAITNVAIDETILVDATFAEVLDFIAERDPYFAIFHLSEEHPGHATLISPDNRILIEGISE